MLEKDALVLKRLRAKPSTLESSVKDVFSGGPGSFRFTRDAQGKVNGFVLNAGRIRNMQFRKRSGS